MKRLKEAMLVGFLGIGLSLTLLNSASAQPAFNRYSGTGEDGVSICHCKESGSQCRCKIDPE